jgi:hypothetical protein
VNRRPPRLDTAAVGQRDSVDREDNVRRALLDLNRSLPAGLHWNIVRQISAEHSAVPGMMVVFNPDDGAERAALPPARADVVGKRVGFIRDTSSVDPYMVMAFPGDSINGAESLSLVTGWETVVLHCYQRGMWSTPPAAAAGQNLSPTALKSSDYSVAFWDEARFDVGAANIYAELPVTAASDVGKQVLIKIANNTGGGSYGVKIRPPGSETIDDVYTYASPLTISGQRSARWLVVAAAGRWDVLSYY